jgi:hypothetical protein
MADEAHAPPAAACDHGPLLIAEQAAKLIRKDVSRIRQLSQKDPEAGRPVQRLSLPPARRRPRLHASRDHVDRRKKAGSMTSRVADARAR